ncbi:PAS domain S-box protein [Vitiosangium sp. GDMCC 1.1324]|uniref:PAS domain-containing sensor histidine kinase n=1 Tax=Vitiosangium sp. (strain GDMCC 1.1324) TaxID=2138576 RepID=UPI000D3D09A8|nr:PAS domain S-box protein [Vitiosangium sp. GDMCC 1.1324]PTL76505.1 PAS domain-containing sensor histidine kinase [Vitiosangium sp. GDMCC 1.1324]
MPEAKDFETVSCPPDLLGPLIDGVAESVIVRDLGGRVLLWNKASESLYGFARDAMLGRHLHDSLEGQHPATLARLERQVLEQGHWEGELTRTTASGEERRIEVRWTVLRDPEGQPASIIEYGRDITRLSDLEVESRQQAHRYRNLFQAMAASFWELDFSEVRKMLGQLFHAGVEDFRAYFAAHPEFIDAAIAATRVVDVNDKTVLLFGAGSREDLVGGTVVPFWPPESRHVYAESLMASVNRLPSLSRETRLSTLDGRMIDALFTVCWPSGHHGRGTVLVGVIDLSDRVAAEQEVRASELRYRSLFQAMSTALFQIDTTRQRELFAGLATRGVEDIAAHLESEPDFLTTYLDAMSIGEVNEAAVRIMGAKDRSELIGQPVSRFWPRSSHPVVRRSLVSSFRRNVAFEQETVNYRLDGTEINTLFTINASPELRARNLVLVGLTDITERVAAQKALRQLQSEFAHASRLSMLGELTASIAHEVNQPLAAITANGAAGARWLSRPQPDLDEVRTIHANMVSDARRAADIIARIRAMASNKAAERQRLPPNQVVEEAVRFLHHELVAHEVDLHLALTSGLPDIEADRVQLQQTVVNLALNAMQEMKRAGCPRPRLDLRTLAVDGELHFAIEDSGPGIPPEHHDRLFQSFFTTKTNGLGIGLSICRTIIEAHGGRIWAENIPSGGARFIFTVPFAK